MRHSLKRQRTGIDLVPVYRRTTRRQFANCIGGDEDYNEHQECAPFMEFFVLDSQVYTEPAEYVKDKETG